MIFFVGMHNLHHCHLVPRSCVTVNRLFRDRGGVIKARTKLFDVDEWIMDSGSFGMLKSHGRHTLTASDYAGICNYWFENSPGLMAVATQDMMPAFTETVTGAQQFTVSRYHLLREAIKGFVMPVLQGGAPSDYARHIDFYGPLLGPGTWTGVGSLVPHSDSPELVYEILAGIKARRPDLLLHGFGLKEGCLLYPKVRDLLYSSDSSAWAGRSWRNSGNAHCTRAARRFFDGIQYPEITQKSLL